MGNSISKKIVQLDQVPNNGGQTNENLNFVDRCNQMEKEVKKCYQLLPKHLLNNDHIVTIVKCALKYKHKTLMCCILEKTPIDAFLFLIRTKNLIQALDIMEITNDEKCKLIPKWIDISFGKFISYNTQETYICLSHYLCNDVIPDKTTTCYILVKYSMRIYAEWNFIIECLKKGYVDTKFIVLLYNNNYINYQKSIRDTIKPTPMLISELSCPMTLEILKWCENIFDFACQVLKIKDRNGAKINYKEILTYYIKKDDEVLLDQLLSTKIFTEDVLINCYIFCTVKCQKVFHKYYNLNHKGYLIDKFGPSMLIDPPVVDKIIVPSAPILDNIPPPYVYKMD